MPKKNRQMVVLIDYENISRQAIMEGKILDFKKFRDELLEIGNIDFAFVFIYPDMFYGLPEITDLGFEIIACPKRTVETYKIEDTVDIHIIRIGLKLLRYKEITDIVIVSNDRHMAEIIKEAKNHGKTVHLFGTKSVSSSLKKILESSDLKEIPLKEN
ncbi:MAG: hypothetical protein UW50_C0001G0021 [Candidatus Wolfebacteria bacterium GW2011_GWA1_44_24]|uniref:NYN domain-containing protein n=2 Tax=Candidatus Wolfeibacteriota TaxID=1752735 RepID=A0A0G0WWS4_9BACT|nr:MAG: hypothetical protein UU38_C0003G0152 [Candidatus Wolfebacteria bacterium GW2011_GWB1_41_12]KKT56454.1 MAG: hypothetical protein UW50_C0001G0021 [Candidatus Wolfebacteria bacterium GW2011_GWA1_44_24]